ncbi:MAG TPA: flagellar biosynthetic protein FliO [Bdellovibrionota bacterium]|nr:flagellar biosynthetic protein FliO [Bdellovibrionota bacterium]
MTFSRVKSSFGFALFLLASPALASVNLKQVQVSGGSRVDLLFDGKLARNQIKVEYFNDVIQLSMTDTAIYPAKISSVSGGELTKVFAYQYAPKLVRCRLSVKGKAEEYRPRLILDQKGKMLTIRFADQQAAARSTDAKAPEAKPASDTITTASAARKAADADESDPAEKALLERVLSASKEQAKAEAKADAKDAKTDAKAEEAAAPKLGRAEPKTDVQGPPADGQRLTGGKPIASPLGMIGKTLLVLALFGVFALLVRRALNAGAGNVRKAGGPLGRFLQRGLSRYGKTGKMIEVVSTHYLGPKKSIAVVRVAGRMLVLGISQDSINLITQLGAETDLDAGDIDLESLGVKSQGGAGAESSEGPMMAGFDRLLSDAASRPTHQPRATAASPIPVEPAPGTEPAGVRARIRSRLEGMKPL